MTRFSNACQDFGLTISLKKTQVMGQDTDSAPAISINDHALDVIHDFVYLGSAISDTLSLDAELNRRIGKAATTMTRLANKAWNNSKLTMHTKIQIYRACVVSTLLYGSESWTLRARQVRKLNAFHMRSLRRILNITWQDKVPNNCPGKNWMHQHVHAAETETYALARPLRAHGRRTDPQRPPLWRTRAGKTSHGQTTAAIQRCVQEGPKSLEHRPEQLGSNSPQTVSLETDCAERSLQLRRDARSAGQEKENEKKGCSPCRQASVRLRLCPLPQGLSLPHRTG